MRLHPSTEDAHLSSFCYLPHPRLLALLASSPSFDCHFARYFSMMLFCCPFPYLVDYHFDDKRQVNVKCELVSVQGDRQTINVYQFITNMFLNCNFINKYCPFCVVICSSHTICGYELEECLDVVKCCLCFIFLRGNKWKLCTNITWIIIIVVNLILSH